VWVTDAQDKDGKGHQVFKFTPEGKVLMTLGKAGVAKEGPDQDGRFLDQWKQFGRPSGVYIDKNDNIYVADSQSNATQNPGFKRGIRIGSAKDGKVTAMIPFTEPDPDKNNNAGVEGVAADANGNVYGAEVSTQTLKKYVKK
jgi:hypothetical protein